jgi:hypothetical protein
MGLKVVGGGAGVGFDFLVGRREGVVSLAPGML